MIDKKYKRLSVRAQCRLLDLNRSTLYAPLKLLAEDTELANRIGEIYEATPQYGYRRIHAQLNREGRKINRKRVYRLMKELGLQAIYPKPKTTIRDKGSSVYPYLLEGLKIERSHQAWQVDITYFKLPGGFVYLTCIIDVYSRAVVGWRLSNSLSKDAVLEALEDALWRYGCPEVINSDQGSQFTSLEWQTLCQDNGIKISMSHKGGSTENAHIERFWRTLKYEGFYLNFPETIGELKTMLKEFIRWYNEDRLHSSLKYKPPMEVLKMTNSLTRGYVENSKEFPTYPPVPQQQELLHCFLN